MKHGLGAGGVEECKGFRLLVFPKRTLRQREYLSACWYSTPVHLRRVDERSQKTFGRRIPLKG